MNRKVFQVPRTKGGGRFESSIQIGVENRFLCDGYVIPRLAIANFLFIAPAAGLLCGMAGCLSLET
jgi:hypothetical protein